jgi:hypothetical protein
MEYFVHHFLSIALDLLRLATISLKPYIVKFGIFGCKLLENCLRGSETINAVGWETILVKL